MADQTGPLSAAQIDDLIQKIKDCDTAQREIDMAIRAGVPIGDAQAQLTETRSQLMKIKQTYAPNRVI